MLILISHVTMHVNCGGSVRSEEELSTGQWQGQYAGREDLHVDQRWWRVHYNIQILSKSKYLSLFAF